MQNFMCLDELGDKSDLPLHFPFLQLAISSPPSLLVHIVSLPPCSRRSQVFAMSARRQAETGLCKTVQHLLMTAL